MYLSISTSYLAFVVRGLFYKILKFLKVRHLYKRYKSNFKRREIACYAFHNRYSIFFRVKKKRYGMHSVNNKRLKKLKAKFYEFQLGYCRYCARHFKIEDLTFDHLTPKSKHGSNKQENLILCCSNCNNKKGNRSLEEYKIAMNKRAERIKAMLNKGFELEDSNKAELQKICSQLTAHQ